MGQISNELRFVQFGMQSTESVHPTIYNIIKENSRKLGILGNAFSSNGKIKFTAFHSCIKCLAPFGAQQIR